jgi:hypothetical protein
MTLFCGMKKISSPPERTFQIALTESEICLIVTQLMQAEHEHLRLSRIAYAEGLYIQSAARKESAAKAMDLADRLKGPPRLGEVVARKALEQGEGFREERNQNQR